MGEEAWGKPELAKREAAGRLPRKEVRGELGGGVCMILPAQVCAGRGAMGFPGEPGKPSQLDSGFPPASGLGCCKRHGSRWVLKPTLQFVGSPCPLTTRPRLVKGCSTEN